MPKKNETLLRSSVGPRLGRALRPPNREISRFLRALMKNIGSKLELFILGDFSHITSQEFSSHRSCRRICGEKIRTEPIPLSAYLPVFYLGIPSALKNVLVQRPSLQSHYHQNIRPLLKYSVMKNLVLVKTLRYKLEYGR